MNPFKSNYFDDPIYKQLTERFQKLFTDKYYDTKFGKFNQSVWFLKNKINLNESTPKGNTNEMCNILRDLSLNGNNLKKLSVQVEKFIEKICDKLYESNLIKINLEKSLKKINIEKINHKLSKSNFYSSRSKKLLDEDNVLNFSSTKIDNLSEGEYEINIIYKFHNKSNEYSNISSILKINKKNKQFDQPLVLNKINIDKEFDQMNRIGNVYNTNQGYDNNFYPLKEFYFMIKKNSEILAISENISVQDILINSIDKIIDNSKLNLNLEKEAHYINNSSLDKLNQEEKIIINFDLEILYSNKMLDNILSGLRDLHEMKKDDIKNYNEIINSLKIYFDDEMRNDIENIFNGQNVTKNSCVCLECIIF